MNDTQILNWLENNMENIRIEPPMPEVKLYQWDAYENDRFLGRAKTLRELVIKVSGLIKQ